MVLLWNWHFSFREKKFTNFHRNAELFMWTIISAWQLLLESSFVFFLKIIIIFFQTLTCIDRRLEPLFERDKSGGRRFVAPRPASKLFNNDGDLAHINAWNDETVKTPNLFRIFFVGRDTCVSNDCCYFFVCFLMYSNIKCKRKREKRWNLLPVSSFYYFRIYVIFFLILFLYQICSYLWLSLNVRGKV